MIDDISQPPSNGPRSWARIDLTVNVATVSPGRYSCIIADARIVQNNAADTVWLFLTLEPISDDGQVLGQVEDKFITLAAAPNTPHHSRIPEGLRRLSMYGAATGLDFNGQDPLDIPDMLIGKKVMASVMRKGSGIHAENKIGSIAKVT